MQIKDQWDTAEGVKRMQRSFSSRYPEEFWQIFEELTHSLPRDQAITIADLGSGPGLFLENLNRIWPRARLIGVDGSDKMLAVARKRLDARAEFYQVQLGKENLPISDNWLDLIHMGFAFHEIPETVSLLREILRVLKNGGLFLSADWKRVPLAEFFRFWATRSDSSLEHVLSRYSHMGRFELEDLEFLFHEVGFQDVISRKLPGPRGIVAGRKP